MKYVLSVLLICLPATAQAGKTEGDACAASLSQPAQTIYQAVAPEFTPSADLRSIVRSKARRMVMSGKMSRSEAKAAATEAAPCLKKLKN